MRLRAANRDVIVHLPLGGDTTELYVASAASKIFVGPQAQAVLQPWLAMTENGDAYLFSPAASEAARS